MGTDICCFAYSAARAASKKTLERRNCDFAPAADNARGTGNRPGQDLFFAADLFATSALDPIFLLVPAGGRAQAEA